jgi:hypothetical protein
VPSTTASVAAAARRSAASRTSFNGYSRPS